MACWGFLFLRRARWGELRITSAKSLSLSRSDILLLFCHLAGAQVYSSAVKDAGFAHRNRSGVCWMTGAVRVLHTLHSGTPLRINTPHKALYLSWITVSYGLVFILMLGAVFLYCFVFIFISIVNEGILTLFHLQPVFGQSGFISDFIHLQTDFNFNIPL